MKVLLYVSCLVIGSSMAAQFGGNSQQEPPSPPPPGWPEDWFLSPPPPPSDDWSARPLPPNADEWLIPPPPPPSSVEDCFSMLTEELQMNSHNIGRMDHRINGPPDPMHRDLESCLKQDSNAATCMNDDEMTQLHQSVLENLQTCMRSKQAECTLIGNPMKEFMEAITFDSVKQCIQARRPMPFMGMQAPLSSQPMMGQRQNNQNNDGGYRNSRNNGNFNSGTQQQQGNSFGGFENGPGRFRQGPGGPPPPPPPPPMDAKRCFEDFCPTRVLQECKTQLEISGIKDQCKAAMMKKCNCLTNNNSQICERHVEHMIEHMDRH